jgi:PAS domain S-box-containing protein
LLLGAALSLGLALLGWRRRAAAPAPAFVCFMLGVGLWSAAYGLEMAAADLSAKLRLATVEYAGIVLVPASWVVFALHETGQSALVGRRLLGLLAIEPLATLLLLTTNSVHSLFRSAAHLEDAGSFVVLVSEHGPAFWVHTAYSYLLLLVGTVMIVRRTPWHDAPFRGQATALLAGALVPWLANALYLSGLSPFGALDLSPFAFVLTGLLVAIGVFRYSLLDIVPVAREAVVDGMADGVVVLDSRGRVLDANQAAAELLGLPRNAAVGRPLDALLPAAAALVAPTSGPARAELLLGDGEAARDVEARISSLGPATGRPLGRVLVLRDVTKRRRAERALRDSEDRYRTLVRDLRVGVLLHGPAGELLAGNTRALEMLGLSEGELEAGPPLDPMRGAMREDGSALPEAERPLRRALASASPVRDVVMGVRPAAAAAPAWLLVNAEPRLDSEGRVAEVICTLSDITSRKAHEEALRRTSEYLASLHETALGLLERRDLDTLLEALVGRATTLLEVPHGFLCLEDPEGSLACRASVGGPPPEQLTRPGASLVARVFETGEPLASDEDAQQQVVRAEESPGYGSLGAVPLRLAGGVKGVLCVAAASGSRRSFGETELRFLSRLAELASIALDNARLHGATQRELAERQRVEEELRKLTRAVEQSSASILITDTEGRVEYVNPALEQVSGYSRDELLGRNPRVFKSDLTPRETYADLWRTIRAGRQWRGEFVNRRKDGSLYWEFASISAVSNERGEATHFVAVKEDVSDRKRTEEALRESEERFRQLADNVDAIFFIRSVTPDRLIYVSSAYARLTGRSPEPLFDDPLALLEIVHPEDRDAMREALLGRSGFALEYRMLRADGAVRWMQARAFPVRGPDGVVRRVAGIVEDVTARKQAERLREDLADTLVHDLKNPLTAVMGSVDLLAQTLPESHQRAVRLAQVNSRKLLDLIDTILDVSRLESGVLPVERTRVALAPLVAEAVELQRPLAAPKRLRLASRLDAGLPDAWADRTLVGRVLQNLLGNAIKFTPDGGSIEISAELDASLPRALRVSVGDSGPGIADDVRERLFEKFVAGRQAGRGSGLGLSFCRLAVEAQGGRIWVESQGGSGTTFRFTLPAVG